MEKLIKLLNEYEEEIRKSEFYEWEKGVGDKTSLFRRDTRDEEGSHIYSDTADTYVISKKYGFIKWLVDNDKIDFEGKLNTLRFESLVDQTLDSYYALLMLLSIQDEPIQFLISLLK